MHVTLRIVDGVPSLRSRRAWATIVRAMRAARGRFGLDVVHYAVLGNHVHLLVETRTPESLEHGMRGLCTRLAKRGAPPSRFAVADFGTSPAKTWLLNFGWRRHGLLATDEVPGPHPPRR